MTTLIQGGEEFCSLDLKHNKADINGNMMELNSV